MNQSDPPTSASRPAGGAATVEVPGVAEPRPENLAIGVDMGGTGIKAAVVDVLTGELRSERVRVPTPHPATPARCIDEIVRVVAQTTRGISLPADAPIGVAVPAVTIDGIVLTATNIDEGWLGFDARDAIQRLIGRTATIINDADAAGLAEMHFGAGRGRMGTVLLITLGTGIGSALFRNGELVPNTELGHIEIHGRDAHVRAAAVARIRRGVSWAKWADDVDDFLHRVDMLVWADLIIIGGGVSKDADKFLARFSVRPPVVAAELKNNAGIVGAAWSAARSVAAPSTQHVRPADIEPALDPTDPAVQPD